MPVARFQMPDGRIGRFEVPEGTTPEQAQQMISAELARSPAVAKPAAPKERSWGDVPLDALKNLPASAGNFVSGIASAVRHPIDTASGLLDVGAGGLQNLMPESVRSA